MRQRIADWLFGRGHSPFSVVLFFLGPALSLYLVFVIYPLIQVFIFSLFRWRGITRGAKTFIGLGNFGKLVHDSIFWRSLGNNMVLFLLVATVSIVAALFFAYFLTQRIRLSGFYRATWLFPNMLGDVVVATIWLFIYNPTVGLLNFFLRFIGLDIGSFAWLGRADTALFAVAFPMIWKYMGLYIILFLAAMQEIPQSLLDAAKVDGARRWQEFFYIVLPLLRPTIGVATVFFAYNSFNVIFTYVKVMTEGGPYRSTEVLPTYVYQVAFSYNEFGYASAISVVTLLILLAIASVTIRVLMRQLVREEGRVI